MPTSFSAIHQTLGLKLCESPQAYVIPHKIHPAVQKVRRIRSNIRNEIGSGYTTTNSTGDYSFINIPAGVNYTVTPENVDYIFSPTSQSFNNLSDHQTANFTPTYRYGSIGGRITDADGKAMYFVKITLSGAQNMAMTADANGNYRFSRLLKDDNYFAKTCSKLLMLLGINLNSLLQPIFFCCLLMLMML